MFKSCAKKLRNHAGTILSDTSGDKLRNSIADGFIDIARVLEKINTPIEKIINIQCFWYSLFGGFISAIIVLIFTLVLK